MAAGMPPFVSVATGGLRCGLFDVLDELAGQLRGALSLISEESPVVRPARLHYLQVRAVGDLLEQIGWAADELAPPFRLDIGVHGWAAVMALRRLVARERCSAWQYAAIDEPEAAGEAGGRRVDAEHQLGLIHAVCVQAKVTIKPPAA